MGADLYIHIMVPPLEDADVEYFTRPCHNGGDTKWDVLFQLIMNTPKVYVGEVSWLKAALFDDNERFVPKTIEIVNEILTDHRLDPAVIALMDRVNAMPVEDFEKLDPLEKEVATKVFFSGRYPVIITEEIIKKIEDAFNLDNTTGYSLGTKDDVVAFLRENINKPAFPISW